MSDGINHYVLQKGDEIQIEDKTYYLHTDIGIVNDDLMEPYKVFVLVIGEEKPND